MIYDAVVHLLAIFLYIGMLFWYGLAFIYAIAPWFLYAFVIAWIVILIVWFLQGHGGANR